MPDIFDQLAAEASQKPQQGDIFDQLAAEKQQAAAPPPAAAATPAIVTRSYKRDKEGFTAEDYGAPVGAKDVPVPAGDFERAMSNYGDAAFGQSTPGGSAVGQAVRGLAQAALNLASPAPLAEAGVGTVAALGAGAVPALGPALARGLGAFFTYEAGRGALKNAPEVLQKYQAGDVQGAARAAGYTGVNALIMAAGARGAVKGFDEYLGNQNERAADSVAHETLQNVRQGGQHPKVEDFGPGTYIDALEEQPGVSAGPEPAAKPQPKPAPPPPDIFDKLAAEAAKGKPHDVDQQHPAEPERAAPVPAVERTEADSARGHEPQPARPESVDRVVARPAPEPDQPQPGAVGDSGRREEEAPQPAAAPDEQRVGRAGTTYTASGTKVPFRYEVVDAKDLRTSFDPGFDQTLQPRDTDRAASQARIDETAARMNPALMADSPIAGDGAPILGPGSNDAETRNHGIESLRKMYRQFPDKAQEYRDHLAERAPEFGLDPDQVAAVPNPVLVRRRTAAMTPEQRLAFVQEANGRSTAAPAPSELAAMDKGKLTGDLMSQFRPSEDGGIKTADNREFIRRFLGEVVGQQDAGSLQLPNGELNQAGENRIRNAIFAKAYGDSSIVERLAESTDDNIKTVTSSLLKAAPKFAKLADQAATGDRFDPGIAEHLAKAGETLSSLRQRRSSLADHLSQAELPGQEMHPVVRELLQVFRDHGRSGARIGQILSRYADAIDEYGSPKQETMFGPPQAPNPLDVLRGTVKELQQKWADERARAEAGRSEDSAVGPVEPVGGPGESAPERPAGVPGPDATRAPANREVSPVRRGSVAGESAASPSQPSPAKVSKEPWQKTRDEFLAPPQPIELYKPGEGRVWLDSARISSDPSYAAYIEKKRAAGFAEQPAPLRLERTKYIPSVPLENPNDAVLPAGGYLYHYTPAKNIPSIARRGITPRKSDLGRSDYGEDTSKFVYALKSSNGDVFSNGVERDVIEDVGDWAILRFPRLSKGWEHDPEFTDSTAAVRSTSAVDPRGIEVLTRDGWKPASDVKVRKLGEHRALVEKAVKSGKPVPSEVLAEYPAISRSAKAKMASEAAPAKVAAGNEALPPALRGAKPRFGFGDSNHPLTFERDLDKAAYITVGLKRSAYHRAYLDFARRVGGFRSESEVLAHGRAVRAVAKSLAKSAEKNSPLHVPAVEVKTPAPSAISKVADALKSEEGSVHFDEFQKHLERAFPAAMRSAESAQPLAEPKYDFSKTGALKDKFVRNLSQLEAFPKPHAAAVRAATSKSQAAVLLRTAVPVIEKTLAEHGGPDWMTFRQTLIESRLRGIRDRWARIERDVRLGTDENLSKAMEGGHLTGLLQAMGTKRDAVTSVADAALARAAAADWQGLREYLASTFRDARNSVATVMEPAEFDKWKSNPGFRAGFLSYKELIEQPMATSHALNDGVFSDALGPLDTYYPLIPVKETTADAQRLAAAAPFVKPKNLANDFATGLAHAYDLDMQALRDRLERSMRANSRAGMLDTLAGHGLIKAVAPGELVPKTINLNGEEFAAGIIETKPARQVVKNGKPELLPSEAAVMPLWLKDELEPILNSKGRRPGAVEKLLNAINAYTLAGPTDLVYHATNLVGTMVANTPFLGDSITSPGVALANLPFAKVATAVVKILATDTGDEAAAKDLTEMAKLGLVPERFGSVTYSQRFARQTGADVKRVSLAPLLYGPKGVDIRARLALYRVAKAINPKLQPLEAYQFVNQLGNYTQALQGSVERATKRTGLAPFYTAGSTMLRNGINATFGTGPLPKAGWTMRLAQQLTGGLAGAIALWALAHRAYRGKWPWEEKESKLLQIPVLARDRKGALGRALWGTKKGTAYVDFSFFNPLVSRGLSAVGAKDAYEAHQLGGTGGQQLEGALKGVANGVTHPFTSGPAVRAATILGDGSEPYITSVHPLSLMPATQKTRPGLPMVAERAKEAALSLNPFVQKLAGNAGVGHAGAKADEGNRALRMAVDLALPRLVGHVSNQNRKAAFLRNSRNRER